MIKVEFQYKEGIIFIQAIEEDKMRQVCTKFCQKTQIDISRLYFIYSGNIVNLDLSIEQIINKLDKERKTMSIIVNDYSNDQGNANKIRPPFIICPICKEAARYKLENYRIKIYNCKNGHIIDNLLLKDFENTQLIDESLIVCDKCKKNNKSNTYNKEMYICNICNMNLCPLCKSSHDNKHKIINYEQKYYICDQHNKEYYAYCESCNKDICILCKESHKTHKIITYDEIIPKDITNEESIRLIFTTILNALNKRIEMIIDRIYNVQKNIELYFKLIENNLTNYNINNINYNILQNINYNYREGEVDIFDCKTDLTKIMDGKSINEFLPMIFKMYNGMNKNEIDLVYNIPNNNKEIKIFGDEFVERNKDLCKIIYKEKQYDLAETFTCNEIKDNILKIKLIGINNVTDLTSMFEGCSHLSNLSNFSNFDTTYVILMDSLFSNCDFFELPDISNWNTGNVRLMKSMFEGCSSLKSLPDISNWNTANVIQMNSMFEGCSSLISLPDISNWNTCKVADMNHMFKGCSSLKSLSDISKWDITNTLKFQDETDGIKGMFDGCSESLNIPDKFKNIK